METDGKSCVLHCKSKKRAFDETAGEYVCVPECPARAPFLDKTQTCVACADANPANPFWDVETKKCRTCTDADGGLFWDSAANKCVGACPQGQYVSAEDTMCVGKCETGTVHAEAHGQIYWRCIVDYKCPGYYYTGTDDAEPLCVDASVCEKVYHGYAYKFTRMCLNIEPTDKNQFDITNGEYECKEETYISVEGENAQCFTKKACPGYVYQ